MGYRIDITSSATGLNFYGTKHYGYSFAAGYEWDSECLKYPSYRYLKYLNKINGYEIWDYCCENNIRLTAKQFNHFIKLYAKEYNEELLNNEIIKDLMKDKSDKLLRWL